MLCAIKAADKGQLAVSEEDGHFLRVLVAMQGAPSVLEIGAASGYSGIWLGLGARETGGRVVSGDAFGKIPKLQGTFDLVFLDAWKPDYKKFFDLVFPRLVPGGVFIAHNVVNKKNEMESFLRTVLAHPRLFTTIVSPSSEGMSVSYKTR